MKFSCTKENLSQALGLVGGMTGKNINLPVLNNILIKVSEQKTELISTNLEVAVIAQLRAKVEDGGSFTVPARTLIDFVNLQSDDKIDLDVQDNELSVRCGKSTTKIKGSSAEEFPVIPTMESGRGYVVLADDLREGLGRVTTAAAKSEIRPELSGIFCGFNAGQAGQLVLAATDSYRLAESKMPLKQGEQEFSVIMPTRTAQEINHALALVRNGTTETSARLLVGENQFLLSFGPVQIISRLVEGQYPDYTQIIPQNFRTTITIPTAQLVKEMKAAGLFTTSGVNAVTVTVKPASQQVEVTSTSTQTGEYHSELQGQIQGEDNGVLLNNRYVLDGLANINTPDTVIKIINGDSPCIFTPQGENDYLYIVMPIRQ